VAVMTDLSQFAAEGFDPKAWINAACLTVPEGDTLDRCRLARAAVTSLAAVRRVFF